MIRVVVALAVAVSLALWSTSAIRAEDACAGMDAYEDGLLAAGQDFGAWLITERFTERDPATLSAVEWMAFAEHAEATQTALKALAPPSGVAAWQTYEIDAFGFQSAFGRSAASVGLVTTALAFHDQAAQIDDRGNTETAQAIAACPVFAQVYARWDALDQPAGTPEPSATP